MLHVVIFSVVTPMNLSTVLRGGQLSAVSKPGGDAANQEALYCPPVESGENGGWEVGSPQPSQKEEMLLGFLYGGVGVEGSGYVLQQVDNEEFGVLHNLCRGAVDVQWLMVPLCS